MAITQRLKIDYVKYSPTEGVQVFVVPQFMDGEKVVGASGGQMLTTPEQTIIDIGVANKRTDGEWGNREIELYVLGQSVVDTPASPGVPEVPAVTAPDNTTVVRAVVPAIPAQPATTKPRFGDVTTIAWS